jgi:hypothetical protein
VTALVKEVAQKMNHPKALGLRGIRYEKQPFYASIAEADRYVVYYSYFFLLEPEDIPEALRLTGPDDSRLDDERYVDEIVEWIRAFLGITHRFEVDRADREAIRCGLRMMLNPTLYRKTREFVLAHEIGHMIRGDVGAKNQEKLQKTEGWRTRVSAAVAVAGTGALCGVSMPALPAVLCGVGLYKVTKNLIFAYEDAQIDRAKEIGADQLAKKAVGGEGGIFLNRHIQQQMVLARRRMTPCQSLISRLLFNSSGEERFSLFSSHPSKAERNALLAG